MEEEVVAVVCERCGHVARADRRADACFRCGARRPKALTLQVEGCALRFGLGLEESSDAGPVEK